MFSDQNIICKSLSMENGISPYKKYPRKAQAKISAGNNEFCICGSIKLKCLKNLSTAVLFIKFANIIKGKGLNFIYAF